MGWRFVVMGGAARGGGFYERVSVPLRRGEKSVVDCHLAELVAVARRGHHRGDELRVVGRVGAVADAEALETRAVLVGEGQAHVLAVEALERRRLHGEAVADERVDAPTLLEVVELRLGVVQQTVGGPLEHELCGDGDQRGRLDGFLVDGHDPPIMVGELPKKRATTYNKLLLQLVAPFLVQ